MENYQNLVGRLLAGENINIVQKPMDTAAFDIKNRTLYLPIWKDMTPEINDMLICHEVSHALFTPMEYVNALDTKLKFRNARSYLNILEDVRVEKLIKRRYPGIKKSFSLGYKQLNEKDFFGVKNKNLDQSHLMDRINLFYKVGFDCGVKFTEEEKVFVDRAAKTESIHDVIKLAEDIFKFIKESKHVEENIVPVPKMKDAVGVKINEEDSVPSDDEAFEEGEEGEGSEADSSDASGDESGESSDASDDASEGDSEGETGEASDEESEENDEKIDSTGDPSDGAGYTEEIADKEAGTPSDDEEFDDGEITTEDSFSKNSKSLIVTSEEREYIDIDENIKNRIVPFKLLLESYNITEMTAYQKKLISDFYDNNNDAVNYLVKEFEMKKAATSYKKTAIAKSGLLDARKLYAYKIKDDLFRRISISADGKNHGVVILLDWSGSMDSCIRNAIEQVAVLAMFCKRINIPFQVLAFADGGCPKSWNEYYSRDGWNENGSASEKHKSYYLVEIFSHKMGNTDFRRVLELCLTGSIKYIFSMGGTPLTESLIYMYSYLKKFRLDNNVEKLSLITITDGEGSNFAHCSPYTSRYDNDGNRIVKRHFLRVPSNKKIIEITDDVAVQSAAIQQAIKERYECNVIGYFITPNRRNEISRFLSVTYKNCNFIKMEDYIKSELKKNDICCLTDVPGRDMVFILPVTKLKINNDGFEINSGANAKKIAATFCKHLNKKKTSRIFLNKLIEIIA